MDASSPLWTLAAVITGGAVSALTTLLVERGRSRRESIASLREGRREFYLEIVDRTIAVEELIYDLERLRDRASFDALRRELQPLVRSATKAWVVAPREVRAALAGVVTSTGVAAWPAIEPDADDIAQIHHAPFLSSRGELFSAIRDDLDSDKRTLGIVRRVRVDVRNARAKRRYMKGGTDPY